jgi:glyoxylase-like metal-dependent hydrolase (beta-lactamase superfamily II)
VQVRRFVCGRARSNAYVLADDSARALLVDAGMGAAEQVMAHVTRERLAPQAVVLTHGHPDHIWTARHLSEAYGIPTYIHRDDLTWFSDPATGEHLPVFRWGGRALGRARRIRPKRLHVVSDAERIEVGPFTVEVLHTPGHSKGSAALRVGELCFSGDTFFRGNVGRVFLGGDPAALAESIRTKLLPLPDHTALYPGHGPDTSVGDERSVWESYLEGEHRWTS